MPRDCLRWIIFFLLIPRLLSAQEKLAVDWAHSWGGAATDSGKAVVTDKSGNLYIAGSTTSFGTAGHDVLVQKYSSSGSLIWTRTWGGPGDDIAYGVLVDQSGNVYVVGTTESFGAGSFDVLMLKFNTAGDFQWSRTWGGPSFDVGYDLAFDQSGNLTIAAESYSFGESVVLLKLSPAGALVSATTWKGPATYDSGYSVTVDSSGNSIITGTSWDYSVYPNHNTILLLKFDNAGNLIWNRTWAGPSEDEASGRKVVRTDPEENIYVLGHTSPSCTTEDFSQCVFDALLLKVNPSGTLYWARKWGANGFEQSGGLWLDDNKTIETVGSTTGYIGGLQAALIQQYDPSGNILASKILATSAASGWNSLSANNSGAMIATGFGPNNKGTWQDTGLLSVTAPGSLSAPTGSVSNPTGTLGTPAGTISDPKGVLDSGGGGQNVLTAAFAFSASESQPGTISVTSNLSTAKFAITGPKNLSGSGGNETFDDVPAGKYTIIYGNLPGYGTPPTQTKTLSSGEEIVFSGTYTPHISAVSAVLPEERQTIIITGSGFGTHAPYTGDSAYIKVSDVNRAWNAGYSGDPGSDRITLVVDSWTDSSIVLGGFAGNYGPGQNFLYAGDQISIQVWNAQTGQGPAGYKLIAATPAASGQVTLEGLPLSDVPVLRLSSLTSAHPLSREEVAITDTQGHYLFSKVSNDDYIMPVSSGVLGQAGDSNQGPHGYIFAPEFCQVNTTTPGRLCSSSSKTVNEIFAASLKPSPLSPPVTFRLPLPAGCWKLVTEAGGYSLSDGTVDADPSHTNLSTGFYALDIAGPSGTPVLASQDGTVVFADDTPLKAGWGNTVIVMHSLGIYTRYAHLLSPLSVQRGDKVKQGQQLGHMGSTGLSFGSHVHFQFYHCASNTLSGCGGLSDGTFSQSSDSVIRKVRIGSGTSSLALIDFVSGLKYQSANTSAACTTISAK